MVEVLDKLEVLDMEHDEKGKESAVYNAFNNHSNVQLAVLNSGHHPGPR